MGERAGRRISIVRVLVLAAVLSGIGYLAWDQAGRAYDHVVADSRATWFAPYVDVTLTPSFAFEDPLVSPQPDHVLSFVVADRSERCTPSWGTFYDLDAAGRQLDLDRRIVRLREREGEVIVSFGGALNDELAVGCEDLEDLTGAYRAVVERYALTSVDFDIEGTALGNDAANARRAEAVRTLQDEARADDRELAVWLTLPVAPHGLPREALAVVQATLTAGVDLTGVNVMTMNYGASRAPEDSMAVATEKALSAVHGQLARALRAVGRTATDEQVWSMIGATPMVGQNDVPEDVFTLDDASSLVEFASRVKLGRVSMWSANRDEVCGARPDRGRVSNTCSGVDQEPHEFGDILGRLGGELPESTVPARGMVQAQAVSRDDPSISPYPIWRSGKLYAVDTKVVWHGAVYASRWETRGDVPDEQVENPWDSPWRYIGPVLPSDAAALPPPVEGDEPRWLREQVYLKGDRVTHGGFVYESKWWTQGDLPDPDPDRPFDAPWTVVGRDQPDPAVATADAYPAWSGNRTYPPGARVVHEDESFEARAWTKGFEPGSLRAGETPWRAIGAIEGG